MKKFIKEIIVFLVVIFLATNAIGYYRSVSVKSNNLIDILNTRTTISNKSVKKLLANKKPVVINFWGTWCPVCSQEVSTLSALAKRDDIILLTIAVNSGSKKDIKEYMAKKGVNFLVINDTDSSISNAANVSVFPTTIFFNANRDKTIKDSGYTTQAGFLARVKLLKD
jgi:thiol-disulfide isomerase/thioredoxin